MEKICDKDNGINDSNFERNNKHKNLKLHFMENNFIEPISD